MCLKNTKFFTKIKIITIATALLEYKSVKQDIMFLEVVVLVSSTAPLRNWLCYFLFLSTASQSFILP
jgi:hypothetical protein